MSNSLSKGFFIGLISPIIAFIMYVGFYKNLDILETINYLYKVKKLSHIKSKLDDSIENDDDIFGPTFIYYYFVLFLC